jgi:hypothetical protein
MILSPNHNNIEGFGCAWWDAGCKIREAAEWAWRMAMEGAMRDVNNMINQIKSFGDTINNLPRTIPRTAKTIADPIIDTALIVPRHTAKSVKNAVRDFQQNTNNLFNTIKMLFEKLKY